MIFSRKMIVVAAVVTSLSMAGGCSVNKAFSKPAPKDLGFLTEGAPRDSVRAEMGEHVISADTPTCDVHTFVAGSGNIKYARGVLYSLLDITTLALTEIITNPIESAIGTEKIRLHACYNESNKLVAAEKLHKSGTEAVLRRSN